MGSAVGSDDGNGVGSGDGSGEGSGVGVDSTIVTPAPATNAVPWHAELAVQPSWTTYVCGAVPNGTVYCTCEQELPPAVQTAGGPLPVPVSSYSTSVPDAE